MLDPIHVLNTYPLTDEQVAQLQAVSPRLVIHHQPDQNPETTGHPTAEALLCDTFLRDLSLWPRLKWMQISAAGVEHLLANPPWQRGIRVTHFSGIAAVTMAEFIITQILAFTRRLYLMHGFHIAHAWPRDRSALGCVSLRGKTLCIVGYGSVGREAARLGKVFGMRITAVKNRPDQLVDTGFREPDTGDPDGTIPDQIYPTSQLLEALAQADYIALAMPLTPSTRHIINAQAFAAMKPSAFLVNVGRGATIDDAALIQAMNERRIAGACLDVYATEPLPSSSPLYMVPNVITVPHMSGVRLDYWDIGMLLFTENLRRYLAGDPLLNEVDASVGY